ncbi:GreA/GreB family elongation factor [Rhodocytophaga aerolata]|uniref:GreA/GreB family elongation factor n=1 Tax=Rhodocytophaga aerolata TaxID=455078 RepID=A0ABT8RB83_9BACT|nr:GreA/GreB family elongation factor [Rhodocytophaga aerolata]MDO1449325.1 GreA/GreB family elongation factor [Rhodocytophaga aerolata]
MSRAFVKEDDSGEPPIIPPRAALPPGTPNYVTPQGLQMLRAEVGQLEMERTAIEANRQDEPERRRQLLIINGRLSALTERLASARLVEPLSESADQVRFGVTVTLRTKSGGKPGTIRQFTIVGVDEASVPDGRISFVSPLARSIMGATLGQNIALRMGPVTETVEIADICYS